MQINDSVKGSKKVMLDMTLKLIIIKVKNTYIYMNEWHQCIYIKFIRMLQNS